MNSISDSKNSKWVQRKYSWLKVRLCECNFTIKVLGDLKSKLQPFFGPSVNELSLMISEGPFNAENVRLRLMKSQG